MSPFWIKYVHLHFNQFKWSPCFQIYFYTFDALKSYPLQSKCIFPSLIHSSNDFLSSNTSSSNMHNCTLSIQINTQLHQIRIQYNTYKLQICIQCNTYKLQICTCTSLVLQIFKPSIANKCFKCAQIRLQHKTPQRLLQAFESLKIHSLINQQSNL